MFEYLHILRAFHTGHNETFPIGNHCGHIRWECENNTTLCLHGKIACDWWGTVSYIEVFEYLYVEVTISYIHVKGNKGKGYIFSLEPVKLIDEVTKSQPAECDLMQEERSEEIRRLSGEKEVGL